MCSVNVEKKTTLTSLKKLMRAKSGGAFLFLIGTHFCIRSLMRLFLDVSYVRSKLMLSVKSCSDFSCIN
jgi:hypothetical protein